MNVAQSLSDAAPAPLTADAEHSAQREKSTVLLVDDHPLYRRGLAAIIRNEPDLELCCEAANAASALGELRQHHPDAVLLDISMPGTNGLELLKLLLAEQPGLPVVMLSMSDESLYPIRAIKAGAKGYVLKTEAPAVIVSALRTALRGEVYLSPKLQDRLVFQEMEAKDKAPSRLTALTPREREVFEHFGRDRSTTEIAECLSLSVKTIETHRMHIIAKLNVTGADEMVRFAKDWVTLQRA